MINSMDALNTSMFAFLGMNRESVRREQGWNILDLIIISLSVVSIATDDGSSINTFRAIRAIRAVRLLTGLPRLREIVNALVSSVSFASIGPSKDDDTIHPN